MPNGAHSRLLYRTRSAPVTRRGSEVVCCGSSVAARHRGAEEDFLKILLLLLTKFLGA